MYLKTRRRRRPRRSSLIRVLILLTLIGGGIYLIIGLQQEQIENPFVEPPTPTRSALSYALDGDEYYRLGDLEQAILSYEQALTLDPDDVLLHITLARLLVLDGDVEQGLERAEQAVVLAPDNARAWAVLALAHDWNGQVEEAIDAGEWAVELDPTYAEGYAYLAEAYADGVRWEDAMETVLTAVELDETSVDVRRNYGWVLESQGLYEDAVAEYDRAIELHSSLAHLYMDAGRNCAVLGDLETAIDRYKKAIDIDPADPEPYTELGALHCLNGDRRQAEMSFERAIEVDREYAPAYAEMAFCQYDFRTWETANDYFVDAIDFSFLAARRGADAFYVSVHELDGDVIGRSLGEVLGGEFSTEAVESDGDDDVLQAELVSVDPEDEIWSEAGGAVVLDVRSGVVTVDLAGLPLPGEDQVLIGWFDGLDALDGEPLGTGALDVQNDGTVSIELAADWVKGPRIDYLYTYGLSLWYTERCEDAYPYFYAALQMDPGEQNARNGILWCDEDLAEEAEEADE